MKRQREMGRNSYLATVSDCRYADAIAGHLTLTILESTQATILVNISKAVAAWFIANKPIEKVFSDGLSKFFKALLRRSQ